MNYQEIFFPKIKKIAEYLDLDSNISKFKFVEISQRHILLRKFISCCRTPDCSPFHQNNPDLVPDTIEDFMKGDYFQKKLSDIGGSVTSKRGILEGIQIIQKIKNEDLKQELLKLFAELQIECEDDYLVVITKLKKNDYDEKKQALKNILLHEVIHILLNSNNLSFAKQNPDFWEYDEGLVTYLEHWVNGRLDDLQISPDETNKTKYIYTSKAIFFKNKLQNIKYSKMRLKAIQQLRV